MQATPANKVFCNYCPGFCCYRLPGSTLYVDALDINRMARYFGCSDGDVRKRFLEGKNTFKVRKDGACIFLTDGKISKRCSIHPARPRQCREFPYDEQCPYISDEKLLARIHPRVRKSLGLTEEDSG